MWQAQRFVACCYDELYTAVVGDRSHQGWKKLGLKMYFRYLKVLGVISLFKVFLYGDRTRKYDPKA